MEESVSPEDVPSELQGRLSNFDDALSKIEEVLEPLHSVPLSEIHAKVVYQLQILGEVVHGR